MAKQSMHTKSRLGHKLALTLELLKDVVRHPALFLLVYTVLILFGQSRGFDLRVGCVIWTVADIASVVMKVSGEIGYSDVSPKTPKLKPLGITKHDTNAGKEVHPYLINVRIYGKAQFRPYRSSNISRKTPNSTPQTNIFGSTYCFTRPIHFLNAHYMDKVTYAYELLPTERDTSLSNLTWKPLFWVKTLLRARIAVTSERLDGS
ncbi:hypothetical protein EmuJ_000398800 [Echinococcus multilocularis]|uniref:Uncharacterized protein n=1 Tax=Echinococcus multilocularis TaxID=6211 RepID=A0A068Y150_ECHMU|nr:hypothetical protein EmuJ_000398800 [Echinococcus multilocularis]